MSISKQIIYSSSLVALLALFAGYISYRNMQTMETTVDSYMSNAVEMNNILRGIQEHMVGVHKWFYNPKIKENFQLHMDVIGENIEYLDVLGEEIQNNFKSVQQNYLTLHDRFENGAADRNFYTELRETTFHAEQIIRLAQELNVEQIVGQNENLKKAIASLSFWLVILCVFIFFIAGIFGQVIARALSKSLQNLENAAASILSGNFDTRVNIDVNNEFGYLANSLNQMASTAETNKVIEKQKSELERLNVQLKLKHDSLDSFVYRVSHDLKAPLINLISLQNVVRKKVQILEDQSVMKSLDFMNKNTDKLQRTIHDLLEVSRIERTVSKGKEEIKILELVNEVLEENIEEIEAHTVSFTMNLEVEELRFSRPNLKSIFANLITNSIKYRNTEIAPSIFIGSKQKNNTVILEIKDNGIGIDLDKHGHKLFGIFNRFHNHVDGSGVGLYIVKKVVEESGGSVSIESEVGKGTSFFLTLPMKTKVTPAQTSSGASSVSI